MARGLLGPLRRRAQSGSCSQSFIHKVIALDTWFTGVIRNQKSVDHYHNANCPRDGDLCNKVCAEVGFENMLRKPSRYSRRSRHGLHCAVDEIVLAVASQGFLRHAHEDRKKPSAIGRHRPRVALSVGDDAAGLVAQGNDALRHMDVEADKHASPHEEAEAHANNVSAFLQQHDPLLRMLRYRAMMCLFADVRTPVLERAGEDWEALELVSPDRTFAIILAVESERILIGMERLSHIGAGVLEPGAAAAALLSKECLESQALVPQESSQWIEHGHRSRARPALPGADI